MISEPSENLSASPERHVHREGHRRRRRHRQRPFYETWVYPNRRVLKHFALFCAVMILSYVLWAALAK
jgi:hypothetical protein